METEDTQRRDKAVQAEWFGEKSRRHRAQEVERGLNETVDEETTRRKARRKRDGGWTMLKPATRARLVARGFSKERYDAGERLPEVEPSKRTLQMREKREREKLERANQEAEKPKRKPLKKLPGENGEKGYRV